MKQLLFLLNTVKIRSTSLQWRLTVGVALAFVLGLGGVAVWISLRMQQILVDTHKDNVRYIADRFPHDVEIYSDMVSLEKGVQKAIDNLTSPDTLLWVKNPQGTTIAQSYPLKIGTGQTAIMTVSDLPPVPELQQLRGRYWLMCAGNLRVRGQNLGTIYIAQDITGDQVMFLSLMRSLSWATLLAVGGMIIVIACYVRQNLQPLKQMNQLTANISAEKLGEAKIQLENAPSEVKELAQTFDQMLMRLSQSWDHQQQLVSNVSHELRTPLTLVSGYLQSTLRRGNNLTAPQREALEIATSEANRTIQLLQDLLDLARADSGQMRFHLEPLVLNDLVKEVVDMTHQYSDRLIYLKNPSTLLTIKGDANRLKQVLLNLIDNAVKYSEPEMPITIILEHHKTHASIQVRDQGMGIPLQHQTRIFERFYRVDEARSRTTGGTGLGLSIVKTLVEGMEGTISLSSQPNKGSTFRVSFPLNK